MIDEPSMDQAFLKKLTEVVEQNLDNDQFGVEDLARDAGMSRSQLHRKLKKLTRQSASQFIRETRLQHAMEMLQGEVATASEIAYRVGFGSPAYFSKSFHDYYGFPPGEAATKKPEDINTPSSYSVNAKPEQSKANSIIVAYSISALVLLLIISAYLYYTYRPEEVVSAESSVAILPLENLTGDEEQALFVDGLHEALIGELGQLSELRVISRTSTLQFRDTKTNLQDIAEQLNVTNIIEGSVFSIDDSIRIQLRLIQIKPSEHHLWSENYDRRTEHVLSLFSDITQDVAQGIQLTLSQQEKSKLAGRKQVNTEAYKKLLEGNQMVLSSQTNDIKLAIQKYQDAIALDPSFADAYARLAQAHKTLYDHGNPSLEETTKLMRANIDQALILDGNLGNAYKALGNYYRILNDFEKAEEASKKSVELLPNDAQAILEYYWALWHNGNEGKEILLRAFNLDPLHPGIATDYAWWILVLDGRFEEAMKIFDDIIERNPEFSRVYSSKAQLISISSGQIDEAFKFLYKSWKKMPDNLGLMRFLADNANNVEYFTFAGYMEKLMTELYPQNFRRFYINIYNARLRGDFKQAEQFFNQAVNKYGEGFLRRHLLVYATIQFHLGKVDKLVPIFQEEYPEHLKKPPDLTDKSSTLFQGILLDRTGYALFHGVLLDHAGHKKQGQLLIDTACSVIEQDLKTMPDAPFKLLNYVACQVTNGDHVESVANIEKLYFDLNYKAGWPLILNNWIYFHDFKDSHEFSDLKGKIYADLHRMRSNIIDFLKEEGEWREEWEPDS